jgi:hypothetical protein
MSASTTRKWRVSSSSLQGLTVARLTEFLRDFKEVQEEEDLYGDGLGMDIDNIQPKYMKIMVYYLHCKLIG